MAMRTTDRSARMERAFDRIDGSYRTSPALESFTAAGVYDKLGLLVLIALFAGAFGYLAASPGIIFAGIIGGFVLGMIGIFRPAHAKLVGPLYSIAEGVALGGITSFYSAGTSGIAPMAIIFTAGVFVAALVLFRTGIVKVTPRFMSVTLMALAGFFLVAIATMFGMPLPGIAGLSGFGVFGAIGVFIGVMALFIDFNYVQVGEERMLPAEAEWYAALSLMMSLVFVYLNVLRMLGGRRR
ncbi:MAG: hypothetical protein NVSMB12_03170 [Acidimicrobiales bacterium]